LGEQPLLLGRTIVPADYTEVRGTAWAACWLAPCFEHWPKKEATMTRFLIGVLAVLGFTEAQAPAAQVDAPTQFVATTCTRVSGKYIGSLPLVVEVGGRTVRFAEWTTADARSNGVVGFAAELPSGVDVTIEAGDVAYSTTDSRWLHPLGVSGAKVHPIDALSFCSALAPQPLQ
jgi:hypothetical protein